MSVEPSESEYEALGNGVLQRVRRRERRKRGSRLLAVAASAAVVGAVAMGGVGGSLFRGEDPPTAATVTCYAGQSASSDSVTIRRSGAQPDAEGALKECERAWSAGLLGEQRVEFQSGAQNSLDAADGRLLAASTALQECERDGSIAVLPDPERRGAELCRGLNENENEGERP